MIFFCKTKLSEILTFLFQDPTSHINDKFSACCLYISKAGLLYNWSWVDRKKRVIIPTCINSIKYWLFIFICEKFHFNLIVYGMSGNLYTCLVTLIDL